MRTNPTKMKIKLCRSMQLALLISLLIKKKISKYIYNMCTFHYLESLSLKTMATLLNTLSV